MTTPHPTRLVASLLMAGLLGGCLTTPSQQTLQAVRVGSNPSDPAQRTITNFTPALRCMDELMFRNGTRDVTLMMEELRDATQKVPVSARDMMTSAISEMTRRSRAVRLSVFGGDQQNLQQLLQQAQKTSPFAVMPEYNLRGTISQLDEDVRRDSSAFGFLTSQAFGLRLGSETKFSVLGFDSAVVRTDTMTLVSGVSSKNTTVIAKRDTSAGDGQARILNAATVFSFSAARSEGTAQAARNMVELAAIELVGKLIRAPYWQCVGTADNHPEVLRETEDWFLSMDEGERTVFLKTRMRERRYFDGALDEARDAAFTTALQSYRQALGMSPTGPGNLDFFRRFVTQAVPTGPLAPLPRHSLVARAGVPAVPDPADATAPAATTASATSTSLVTNDAAPAAPTDAVVEPAARPAPAPITLLLRPDSRPGSVQLKVAASTPGYVYCYAQDPATQALRRVFPNRYQQDPRVEAGRALSLPATGRQGRSFILPANQHYACLFAPREVYNELPPPLRWGDFDEVKLPSFEAIRQQFSAVAGLEVTLVNAVEARNIAATTPFARSAH